MYDDVIRRWIRPRVDETWKDRAACRGENPELWFPRGDDERHYNKRVRALTMTARAICERCPVQTDCLQYALDVDERHGMYGGLTERERAGLTGRRPL